MPNGEKLFSNFCPLATDFVSALLSGGLGDRTGTVRSYDAFSPLPSALTLIFAVPVRVAVLNISSRSLSPGSLKLTAPADSVIVIISFAVAETLTPEIFLSCANTVTGRATLSPGESTLGAVARIISGSATVTVFSAAPKLLAFPAAVTITLTDPVYCGSLILCDAVFPGARVKGPMNLTTGSKRRSLFLLWSMAASLPPIANPRPSLPPKAPKTMS